MGIAGLARAGGSRQSGDEGTILARHQVLERGLDFIGVGELAQSVGAGAQFARRLWSPQQEHANDAEFLFREFERTEFRIAKTVLVLGHPAAVAGGSVA